MTHVNTSREVDFAKLLQATVDGARPLAAFGRQRRSRVPVLAYPFALEEEKGVASDTDCAAEVVQPRSCMQDDARVP